MNYEKHYNRLVERAQSRTTIEYTEKHHIFPRCLGGTDDASNLVALLPEEHLIAHLLLVKIYPNNGKLIYAANMMSTTRKHTIKKLNNKQYKWLREKYAKQLSSDMMGENNHFYGRTHSEETKRKISIKKKGTKLSNEAVENIRKGSLGRKHSETTKRKISDAHIGYKHSYEAKKKMSDNSKGKNTGINNHQVKRYKIIKPNGDVLILEDSLVKFAKENNLSLKALQNSRDKGKIKAGITGIKTEQSLNTVGWEIKTVP